MVTSLSIYDFSAVLSGGKTRHLSEYLGQVLLVAQCRLVLQTADGLSA